MYDEVESRGEALLSGKAEDDDATSLRLRYTNTITWHKIMFLSNIDMVFFRTI